MIGGDSEHQLPGGSFIKLPEPTELWMVDTLNCLCVTDTLVYFQYNGAQYFIAPVCNNLQVGLHPSPSDGEATETTRVQPRRQFPNEKLPVYMQHVRQRQPTAHTGGKL